MSMPVMVGGLLVAALAFALAGILHARGRITTVEDYISARASMGPWAGTATLMASALGAWVLFGPAEAATWGGIGVVVGYAVGIAAPRVLFVPLGRRMRAVMPEGHGLHEFVRHRFGRAMHALVVLVMVFYLFIFLTAEVTGMARIVALVSEVPLWTTALIVAASTLAYTAYGGVRASIFTDNVQIVLILPLLVLLMIVGWNAVGGAGAAIAELTERAPHLIDPAHPAGLKAGLTLFLALLVTSLFHQGYWQRVYAARDARTVTRSFLGAGFAAALVVLPMGLFGLAYVALGEPGDTASVAVFAVLVGVVPLWLALVFMVLGLALVMSSADTILNAAASMVATETRRLRPEVDSARLMRLARIAVVVMAVPVVLVAAQGYSVLYLFLLADLLCVAVAFPVFFGFYARRYPGGVAALSAVAGLAAGLAVFPAPGNVSSGALLSAFVLALMVPTALSLLYALVLGSRVHPFDFESLRTAAHRITE